MVIARGDVGGDVSGNLHRVFVVDNTQSRKPIAMITQRDVLRALLIYLGQTLRECAETRSSVQFDVP